jgi:hypothetical protein
MIRRELNLMTGENFAQLNATSGSLSRTQLDARRRAVEA